MAKPITIGDTKIRAKDDNAISVARLIATTESGSSLREISISGSERIFS